MFGRFLRAIPVAEGLSYDVAADYVNGQTSQTTHLTPYNKRTYQAGDHRYFSCGVVEPKLQCA